MGQIINLDNYGGSYPDLLTHTGQGGFLSTGYLRDRPAVSAIEADETPQFVVTNAKQGVKVESEETTEHVRPGSGYRMITVITDRRVIIVVGDGATNGDKQFAVPFAEIETVDSEASRRNGYITFLRDGDTRWKIYAGTDGLADLTEYLDEAAQVWVHVENTLDDVKRQLVVAGEARGRSEYDTALRAAKRANQILDTARTAASKFNEDRPGDSLSSRVEVVRERCLRMLSDVHVGRAREATDAGERHWRDDEYEAAYDAYERARSEYDAVLELDRYLENVDEIIAERNRLETVVEHLEQSPLRKAVAADNRATNADDPAVAADHWEDALGHYQTALEVDWGAEKRRFAGDTEKIRDRLRTVAENLTAARRSVANDAMRAGDWYTDAEQYEAALEEYASAREAFEEALETARDCYPAAEDHLETELTALEQRLEQTRAYLSDEDVSVPDRIESDDQPAYDVEATLGTPTDSSSNLDDGHDSTDESEIDAIEAAIDAVEDGDDIGEQIESSQPDPPLIERLRSLAESAFVEVVSTVLTESGWSVSPTAADESYDLLAERSTPERQTMAVLVEHDLERTTILPETVDRCLEIRTAHDDVKSVMLATSSRIGADLSRQAGEDGVRLLDDECLSAIIEAREIALPTARQVIED